MKLNLLLILLEMSAIFWRKIYYFFCFNNIVAVIRALSVTYRLFLSCLLKTDDIWNEFIGSSQSISDNFYNEYSFDGVSLTICTRVKASNDSIWSSATRKCFHPIDEGPLVQRWVYSLLTESQFFKLNVQKDPINLIDRTRKSHSASDKKKTPRNWYDSLYRDNKSCFRESTQLQSMFVQVKRTVVLCWT